MLFVVLCQPLLLLADDPAKMGIVVMHGKGGAPTKHVADLAHALAGKGYLVNNLEMPWSGRRDYDASVGDAEKELEAAIAGLRGQGAQKIFVAGHSQGGVFALHFAGKHSIDGLIAIAPGGSVSGATYLENLGVTLAQARQLIAEGKGEAKTRLADYEGSKGVYPVVTTPTIYVTWFDPEGAMNAARAVRQINPQMPVLWLVAKRDYAGLRKANLPLFAELPKNKLTRLYEPDSDHAGAPSASVDEILRWTKEVAMGGK